MRPVERLRTWTEILVKWVRPNVRTFRDSGAPRLWLLSLIIGAMVAVAAIVFREAIGLVQYWWLRNNTEQTLTAAQNVSWYWILAAPIVGGFIVGLMLERVAMRRAGNVADVIEARALTGRPLGLRDGLWSAAISAVSLGSGASAGREGPVIHLGATLASVIAHRRKRPEWCSRTLLASGVAAAISASFNAPIAGVLFAHEVILQHYAMRSFVPIVIASAVGSVISRIWFGDAAAFIIPDYQITSYWEFPAFALLGVVAAAVAILFQFALFSADYAARSVTIPLRWRPVLGGAMIGALGVFYPHILGVGYEVTDKVLWNQFPLSLLLTLIVLKTVATAITLAARFGGGIFSPSIYLGALTGGAFGLMAGSVFPDMASSEALYAILGMGAVAGAVLGAPISTTVIVFELTGGYALSIALLLTVAIAHGVNQAVHGHSYFHWQLEMRGLFDHQGPHRQLMRTKKVMDFMDFVPRDGDPQWHDPESGYPTLKPGDSLETALRAFDASGHSRLAVVDPREDTRIIAWATQVRALSYFNKALIQASVEEHR
ncbi:chloride channel protein [Roseitalea porphyridii]|uniref:Chloride channel protein n=1 Tax=Roseitalea porphyridii TaxID=1852022 RepID=A0A4P6V3I2_9HYPH|nr:chloride channel protein [Roseitalea porphyridii]QBK31463.1 chloride channel protein [Roseitalea porphyridii]